MAEFTLHPRFDSDEIDPSEATTILSEYADEYDPVSLGDDQIEAASEHDVFVPDHALEIDDIDTYAEIYMELRDSPEVYDVSLWGPAADRFPVRVEHYALQRISTPDRFEFYALDGQVTLVIADSRQELQQIKREVPRAALG